MNKNIDIDKYREEILSMHSTEELNDTSNKSKKISFLDNIDNMSAQDCCHFLLNEIDEEEFADIDNETLTKLRTKINPYGKVINMDEDSYLNFSITNLREKYMIKLLTTSLIGYLNRLCDEWEVPDNVPVVPVYKYLEDPSVLDTDDSNDSDEIKKAKEFNKKQMEKRIIVKEFLENIFKYDPDKHVRGAYLPNPKDPERKLVNTASAKLANWKNFKENEKLEKDITNKLNKEQQEDNSNIINQKDLKVTDKDNNKVDINLDANAYDFIPSDDMFFNFNKYYEVNFEKLREIVNNLYNVKPDFEYAVLPYNIHDNIKDCEKFKRKHKNEVITNIITAKVGKWNLLGPFEENKKRLTFYNDNTSVLESILEQIESDSKLGKDLMKKRVKRARKKNRNKHGKIDKKINQYKRLKGTPGLTSIEDESDDEPDDAIKIDVFKLSAGGSKLNKKRIYTKSEEPKLDTNPDN
mgnify:FL=1